MPPGPDVARNGRSSKASIALNATVLTPMPSANVRIAIAENAGRFSSARTA